MKFTKELTDDIREEFKEYNISLNVVKLFLVRAKAAVGEGYIPKAYYNFTHELIKAYVLGLNKHIPTHEDVIEERNFYLE